MKIDIHRHAQDPGKADRVVRNLFHNQADQIEDGKYYSAGLHPWHVNQNSLDKDLDLVYEMASCDEVIAIGEAGLDKSGKTAFDLQLQAFKAQIRIAAEMDKPLIIHCVRAYNEILKIHQEAENGKPWIVHWYNASTEMGEQLIARNFYLSFGHMLFEDRSKAYKAFPDIPLDRIFFETDDAGYTIEEVYTQAAILREIDCASLELQIENNFNTCFGELL